MWVDFKLPYDSETNTLTTNYLKIVSGKPAVKEENLKIPGANAHIWDNFCPSSPQVLCHHPLFPTAPDEKMVIKSLDVSRNKNDYVQRIFRLDFRRFLESGLRSPREGTAGRVSSRPCP